MKTRLRGTFPLFFSKDFLKFGVVGVLATATHFAALSVFVEGFGIREALANGLAFLVAVSVTYFGQSKWVFREQSQTSLRELVRFTVSVLFGFFANIAIMYVAVQAFQLRYQVGFVLAVLLVPMMTFVINKTWVFREAEHGSS